MLAFVAQDSETRVFCYANSNLRKEQQNDEILRFVEFWKERTGRLPQELVFDSKLTTYANLNELNNMDIDFITLRRRSDKILEQLRQTPGSAWRQIQLSNVSRAFRTPKVLERMIQLATTRSRYVNLPFAILAMISRLFFSLINCVAQPRS